MFHLDSNNKNGYQKVGVMTTKSFDDMVSNGDLAVSKMGLESTSPLAATRATVRATWSSSAMASHSMSTAVFSKRTLPRKSRNLKRRTLASSGKATISIASETTTASRTCVWMQILSCVHTDGTVVNCIRKI